MQKLRVHILKVIVVTLLWAGFGLYIAQPVKATDSSRAFSHWLDQVVEHSDDASLQQQLIEMNSSGSDVYQLMDYLSQHLQKNDIDADLPGNDDLAAKKLYNLLLIDWSHHQTGNGMAKVPPPSTLKTGLALQIEKYSTFPSATYIADTVLSPTEFFVDKLTVEETIDFSLTPMSEGIAIGAP